MRMESGWESGGREGREGWGGSKQRLNETSKTAVGEVVVASLPIGFWLAITMASWL